MTIYTKIIGVPAFVFLCTISMVAQHAPANTLIDYTGKVYLNPVILKHYTSEQLHQMEKQDSLKFKTIVYYYTKSFIVEKITCTECRTFMPQHFDVSAYERFRKKSERYSRIWTKYGFKLTLLSIDELTYKLPMYNQP